MLDFCLKRREGPDVAVAWVATVIVNCVCIIVSVEQATAGSRLERVSRS